MTNSIPWAESAFVSAGDVTLHVRRDPPTNGASPTTPILYLHALGADLRIFDRVVSRLPERTHVRLDLRGHGLSDAPDGSYSIQQLAQDALTVLAATGAGKAILVGVSVGGMVALRAALDRPDKVAGLVLCNTAAKLGDQDVWQARIDTARDQGVGALADSTLLRWFPEQFRRANQPLLAGMANMLFRTSMAGYTGVCAALSAEDLRPRLGELQVQPLVIGGSHDLSTPPPLVAQLANSLPGARLQILDDAGHLPMLDSAEQFCKLLTEYLDERANGASNAHEDAPTEEDHGG